MRKFNQQLDLSGKVKICGMKKMTGLKEAGEQLHRADHFLYKEVNIDVLPSVYELIIKTADQLKLNHFVLEIVFVKDGNLQLIQDKKKASLDFENNFFDGCLTMNAIYFWKDPIAYFKEIYRVLRPGGVFSLAFKEKKAGGNLPWTEPDFTFYDIHEVEAFFIESGFINIELKHITEEILDKEMVTPFVSIVGEKKAG